MKTFDEIVALLRQHKEDLRVRYGLREMGIFGSYARGEQDATSDLDILVELDKPVGFVRFMKLEGALSDLVGVKVEIVTRKALKPHIGRRILDEVRYV